MRPVVVLALVALASTAAADGRDDAVALPPQAAAADLDEALGAPARLDELFTDETGARRSLRSLLQPGRPLILVLGYYRCPALCDLTLRGLGDALRMTSLHLGRDFTAAMVSIDPRETPQAARKKQATFLRAATGGDAPADRAAFPFFVGGQKEIAALADSLGWRYGYDPKTDNYGHPAALMIVTPDGRISRYLYGVVYKERDLRLALVEASGGRIGGIADRLLLTCYRYDASARRYGFVVAGVVKGGGALVLLLLAGGIALGFRRERARFRAQPGAAPRKGSPC